MENLTEGDRFTGILLETYVCPRRGYARVRPVDAELSSMRVEFPTELRKEYPIGTRFRANAFVTSKLGNAKHLKAEYHTIEVLLEDSFEPTYDREILEERTDDLLSIKGREKAQGNQNPQQKTLESTQYERDPGVRADVLDRANGKCERCDKDAPFKKANGKPFLEVHHAIPLGEGGPDTVENAFALCPNCHREVHYGANKDEICQMLKDRIPV